MKTTLKFLELTSNYVQPVRDQHWSASAENRYSRRYQTDKNNKPPSYFNRWCWFGWHTDERYVDVCVFSRIIWQWNNAGIENSRIVPKVHKSGTMRTKIEASDCITDGARGLVGKRGDTAMCELFFPFK